VNIKRRLVPAWEDEFYRRFPLLFADVLEGSTSVSPLTDWGIECGIGWRGLLEKVCGELERMIAAIPARNRDDYRATQVKQKFGTLRLYMGRYTDEMVDAIRVAEMESMDTCETCGGKANACSCRGRKKP